MNPYMGSRTYRAKLGRILLDRLCIQNLSVVLANIKVLVLMLGKDDLLLVVSQLQVGCVIWLLLGHLLAAGLLLLTFLLLLLELLGRLLRLSGEVSCADLAAQDAGLSPIFALNAESDLSEDELGLFSSVHRPKGLNLELAKDLGGGLEIALLLLDVGEDLGDAGTLDFDKDLALCHCSQGLDNGKLGLEVGGVVEEAHDGLDHLGDGLLELAVLLGQDQSLVVHQTPVAGIFA